MIRTDGPSASGRAHQALNYGSVVVAGDLLTCTERTLRPAQKRGPVGAHACTRAHNGLAQPVKDDERPVAGTAGFGTDGQSGLHLLQPLLNSSGF